MTASSLNSQGHYKDQIKSRYVKEILFRCQELLLRLVNNIDVWEDKEELGCWTVML